MVNPFGHEIDPTTAIVTYHWLKCIHCGKHASRYAAAYKPELLVGDYVRCVYMLTYYVAVSWGGCEHCDRSWEIKRW